MQSNPFSFISGGVYAYENVRQLAIIEQQQQSAAITAPAQPPRPQHSLPLRRERSLTRGPQHFNFSGSHWYPSHACGVWIWSFLVDSAAGDADALAWWVDYNKQFLSVADLAAQYLSIPATSVLSERQFSAAGRLVTKLRSRLELERVDTIIFLYKNV